MAVQLGLQNFTHLVCNKTVVVQAEDTTALAYIWKKALPIPSVPVKLQENYCCEQTKTSYACLLLYPIKVEYGGKRAELSKQVLPTKWTLDPLVCLDLWKLWVKPMIDLFASSRNHCLPVFRLPGPDPPA